LRRRLVDGLRGRVVEAGAGTAIQFRHYPGAATEVIASEPEPTLRAMAVGAAAKPPAPVRVLAGAADRLSLADGAVDAGVCAGVLCSIEDPAAALRDLARVIRPAGRRVAVLRTCAFVAPTRGGAPARPRRRRDLAARNGGLPHAPTHRRGYRRGQLSHRATPALHLSPDAPGHTRGAPPSPPPTMK
jgi:SAM-dependent methyltransferase